MSGTELFSDCNQTSLTRSSSAFGRRRGSGWAGRLGAGIDPAGVDPVVQRIRRLWIDIAHPDQASESRLDMPARATEAVIKIEVPEGCIEVVPP